MQPKIQVCKMDEFKIISILRTPATQWSRQGWTYVHIGWLNFTIRH